MLRRCLKTRIDKARKKMLCACFQVSAKVQMRSFFWSVTHCWLVISYRRFGTIYWSYFSGHTVQKETSVTCQQSTLHDIPHDLRAVSVKCFCNRNSPLDSFLNPFKDCFFHIVMSVCLSLSVCLSVCLSLCLLYAGISSSCTEIDVCWEDDNEGCLELVF
jgi:hypothetical protein